MANFTYIKFDIKGFYIEFEEKFNPQLYNNIGYTYQDFLDNLWVLLSDEQVAFHNENPGASVKEVWDMQLTPSPTRTLEEAKAQKLAEIDEYDKSTAVNSFVINETFEAWLTPAERTNYKSSIDSAKLLGVSGLTFFIGDVLMEVTPEQGEYMLAEIQLYADQCYIVTKEHKLNVEALQTIYEVDTYDYKSGYPHRLYFTCPFVEATKENNEQLY